MVTFTDYRKDFLRDKKLLEIVRKCYKEMYIWPQGSGDFDYIRELLNQTKIDAKVIPATLRSFDNLLLSKDLDYVGTRLHGGIRALQHKKRTIIIAVDHKAKSFGRDFNLPVFDENNIDLLEEKIKEPIDIRIKIDKEAIETFKDSLKTFINNI